MAQGIHHPMSRKPYAMSLSIILKGLIFISSTQIIYDHMR